MCERCGDLERALQELVDVISERAFPVIPVAAPSTDPDVDMDRLRSRWSAAVSRAKRLLDG